MIEKFLQFFSTHCSNAKSFLWILVILIVGVLWLLNKKKRIFSFKIDLWIILGGFLFIGLFFISSLLLSKISLENLSSFYPGVFFTIILATITFCGFMLTLTKIGKLIPTIIGFEEALKVATEMIDEVAEDYKRSALKWPRGSMKMVCFTPSLGNLSARRAYIEYEKELKEFAQHFTLEICCLSKEELKYFYNGYLGKFKEGKEEYVYEAYKEAQRLYEILETHMCFKKREFLPTYHYILTPRKAFIFIPFSIPPANTILGSCKKNCEEGKIKIPEGLKDGGVKMLAIQTEDRHIISYLENDFELYYKNVNEGSPSMDISTKLVSGIDI